MDSTSESSASSSDSEGSDAITPAPVGAESSVESRERLVRDALSILSGQRGDHVQVMKVIESSPEWADYDAHVTFEILAVRHAYASGASEGDARGAAMTPARRSQMQAHVRQVQQRVMEQHAEEVAAAYVASLTAKEASRVRQQLLSIETAAAAVMQREGAQELRRPGGMNGDIDPDKLREALNELAHELRQAAPSLNTPLDAQPAGVK